MTLHVKDYQTGETLHSYQIIRFSMNDHVACCTMDGEFKTQVPHKGIVYKLVLTDVDTNTNIEKTVMFTSYNFLIDKDGENPAHITDNSLIFQIMQ